jgi:hypothetical protein
VNVAIETHDIDVVPSWLRTFYNNTVVDLVR